MSEAQATLPVVAYAPPAPCVRCGADLNGKIRRETPAGPACAVPCEPEPRQAVLNLQALPA